MIKAVVLKKEQASFKKQELFFQMTFPRFSIAQICYNKHNALKNSNL